MASALEKDKQVASKNLMKGDLDMKIMNKIKIQWKTIRKAFTDINMEKTGNISQHELKFMLNFWGMEPNEVEFQRVFKKFDCDGDGVISYKDFQHSIGSEMFPQEGLYFRQDMPQQGRITSCNHPQCFQPTKNNQNFCEVH